jgi:uncharacterized protein YjiS (DUF1127 family)
MRCHVQNCEKPLRRATVFGRLARFTGDWRRARHDRKLLLTFNTRMLEDIGLTKNEFSSGFALGSASLSSRTRPASSAVRLTLLTLTIVACATIVAAVTPESTRFDPIKLASCALFPEGATIAGHRLASRASCRPALAHCARGSTVSRRAC